MTKYYDWQSTMSRQTGTNGEITLVLGAKDIGKTFGQMKVRFFSRWKLVNATK